MRAPLAQKKAHVRKSTQTRLHECHWPGCTQQVPPAKWGCRTHWMKLPSSIRYRIWRAYRVGQEETRTPSKLYLAAAKDAQDWIAAHLKSKKT